MVAAAPSMVQEYFSSATMGMATSTIPEDPTTNGIFAADGDHMQVSSAAAPRSTDIITIEILQCQVATLAKKGATIVDQGVNS